VPEIRPEPNAIDRPGGSPEALYASVLPSGSLATICTETDWPSGMLCEPGLFTTGARFVLAIVSVKPLEVIATPSVTETVTGCAPAAV
jgi:hypothetical protein